MPLGAGLLRLVTHDDPQRKGQGTATGDSTSSGVSFFLRFRVVGGRSGSAPKPNLKSRFIYSTGCCNLRERSRRRTVTRGADIEGPAIVAPVFVSCDCVGHPPPAGSQSPCRHGAPLCPNASSPCARATTSNASPFDQRVVAGQCFGATKGRSTKERGWSLDRPAGTMVVSQKAPRDWGVVAAQGGCGVVQRGRGGMGGGGVGRRPWCWSGGLWQGLLGSRRPWTFCRDKYRLRFS